MLAHNIGSDEIRAALLAAAPQAPSDVVEALTDVEDELVGIGLTTPLRWAHFIGQCAHESVGFTRTRENLVYTTAKRIKRVWPGRFATVAEADPFVRAPQRLAERVYGGRSDLGNLETGDGWRYFGRGFLMLTGRANYARFGELVGVDLVTDPELAARPDLAWKIAAHYFATTTHRGMNLFELADRDDCYRITRRVNGATHGLSARLRLTRAALRAITDMARDDYESGLPALRLGSAGPAVRQLQERLRVLHYAETGPADGVFGPATRRAVVAFQADAEINIDGVVGPATWEALAAAGPKPIAPERETITAGDLRKRGSTEIAQGDRLGKLGGVVATTSAVLAGLGLSGDGDDFPVPTASEITTIDELGEVAERAAEVARHLEAARDAGMMIAEATGTLDWVQQTLSTGWPLAMLGIGLTAGAAMLYIGRCIKARRVRRAQLGLDMSR